MVVKATVDKEVLGRFKVGDEVKVETVLGKKFTGKVGAIYSERKEENLEILLDETDKPLPAGSYTLRILKDKEKIEHIPAEVKLERRYYVMRRSPEEAKLSEEIKEKQRKGEALKGIETFIRIGARSESAVEILEGLKEGDEVYVPSISLLAKIRRLREERKGR